MEQKIINYLSSNSPAKLVVLLNDLNIKNEVYYSATLILRAQKRIIHQRNVGVILLCDNVIQNMQM